MKKPKSLGLLAAFCSLAACAKSEEVVEFQTTLGDFEVVLYPEAAPITVANFLQYVDNGSYADAFLHRSVTNFVIQGGGYTFTDPGVVGTVTQYPPIALEDSGLSNLRGTIAMARTADPDSAASQWFINTVDNVLLDTQSGGYTVFGEVRGNGLDVVDAIAALPKVNAGSPFQELPYIGPIVNNSIQRENLVFIDVVRVPEPAALVLLAGCAGGTLTRRRR